MISNASCLDAALMISAMTSGNSAAWLLRFFECSIIDRNSMINTPKVTSIVMKGKMYHENNRPITSNSRPNSISRQYSPAFWKVCRIVWLLIFSPKNLAV